MTDIMGVSNSLGTAMALCVGLFLAGCAEGPEGVATHAATISDPSGTGGTNMLDDLEFYNNQDALLNATKMPLFVQDQNNPQAQTFNGALLQLFVDKEEEGGLNVLKYAMQCALPRDPTLLPAVAPYPGNGVIRNENINVGNDTFANVNSWWSGPLAPALKTDLLACMAAHVNAYGEKVDIGLQGTAVDDEDNLDEGQFTFEEAFWAVTLTGGRPIYHAWPLPHLQEQCQAKTSEALKFRLCGHDPPACNFKEETNLQTCTDEPGNKFCGTMRVIKTRLKAVDVNKLYPGCAPVPPQ